MLALTSAHHKSLYYSFTSYPACLTNYTISCPFSHEYKRRPQAGLTGDRIVWFMAAIFQLSVNHARPLFQVSGMARRIVTRRFVSCGAWPTRQRVAWPTGRGRPKAKIAPPSLPRPGGFACLPHLHICSHTLNSLSHTWTRSTHTMDESSARERHLWCSR